MRNLWIGASIALVLVFGITGAVFAQEGRAWIGVSIADGENGVTVQEVMPNSPAASAGIQADDVIMELEGASLATAQELIDALRAYKPGDAVELALKRGEENLTLSVELGTFPQEMPRNRRDDAPRFFGVDVLPNLGVLIEETDAGWQVTQVLPFMQESQLEAGDIITAINGEAVAELNRRDLLGNLRREAESLEVTILRDGEEITLELDPAIPFMEALPANRPVLGVQFVPLTEAFAQNLGIETTAGALLTAILPDTPAAEAGLQAGDIVTAVNETAIDAENNLADLLNQSDPGDTVSLRVIREGAEIEVEVTLAEQDIRFNMPQGFQFHMPDGGRGFDFHMPEGGRGFDFRMPDGGRGFDFRMPDGGMRPFEFRGFRGNLQDFLDRFGGADLIPEDGLSIICKDAEGNTVFSFDFRGNLSDPALVLPDLDRGMFRNLDCSLGSAPQGDSL